MSLKFEPVTSNLYILQIKELTEAFVNCQTQLEKTTRDKISLMAEVEAAKGQMDNFDLDYGKV